MADTMQKERSFPLNADFVADAAAFLDCCFSGADLPEKQANRLRIAADEVLSNLAFYSGAAVAAVRFAAADGAVVLTFLDDGIPYNPLDRPAPDLSASAEERPLGGLGLLLVKRLMDDVTYCRNNGQNILTLRLQLH